jgi:zinc finger CCHC domain-containing protein 9
MLERARANETRRENRITNKHQQTTCFACRGVGHAARDCPNVLLAARGGEIPDGTAAMLEGGSAAADGEGAGAQGDTGAAEGAKPKEEKGMKRGKGKKGGELTTGRCYR